jgi:peptidoglycan/xylan/chitin deacetylase (PgdA/CDA1 family)
MALPGPTIAVSWDDGTVCDRRLVELFAAAGMPATFFLNSGKLGLSAAASGWRDHVRAEEVPALYADHEVGGHTVDHPDLLAVHPDEAARQIGQDRIALQRLTGRALAGFAPPFGSMDRQVSAAAALTGYRYVRGIAATGGFDLPADLLQWQPTVHCVDFDDALVAGFLADRRPQRLLVWWGHSYEYEDDLGWDLLAHQLELMRQAQARGVRIATMGQVAAELAAAQRPV